MWPISTGVGLMIANVRVHLPEAGFFQFSRKPRGLLIACRPRPCPKDGTQYVRPGAIGRYYLDGILTSCEGRTGGKFRYF
jgi:hypothetical protein